MQMISLFVNASRYLTQLSIRCMPQLQLAIIFECSVAQLFLDEPRHFVPLFPSGSTYRLLKIIGSSCTHAITDSLLD